MATKVVVTTTYTRPSGSVEFYKPDLEFTAYRMKKYIDSKKILDEVKFISEDGLTRVWETTFAFRECFLEHQHDPIIKENRKKQAEYNKLNGIVATFTKRIITE